MHMEIKIVGLGAVVTILLLYLPVLKYLVKRLRSANRFSPFSIDENIRRLPGESERARNRGFMLDMMFWLSMFPLALSPLFQALIGGGGILSTSVSLVGSILLLSGCVYQFYNRHTDYQASLLGVEGEEYTGQELNQLMKEGVDVFHDVPYQYGNIDHIIVGWNIVLLVETKAVRKPQGHRKNSRLKDVVYSGDTLEFPHFTTKEPLEQALRHKQSFEKAIKEQTGVVVPVRAIVALPGWFVTSTGKGDVIVINPKNGGPLTKFLGTRRKSEGRAKVIAYIDGVSRIRPASRKTDPNADTFLNEDMQYRQELRKLGD